MSSNNVNFKKICMALQLKDDELIEICKGEISKSKLNAYRRSPDATKSASGNAQGRGQLSRYRPMPDEHFALFCAGLFDWVLSNDLRLVGEDTENDSP